MSAARRRRAANRTADTTARRALERSTAARQLEMALKIEQIALHLPATDPLRLVAIALSQSVREGAGQLSALSDHEMKVQAITVRRTLLIAEQFLGLATPADDAERRLALDRVPGLRAQIRQYETLCPDPLPSAEPILLILDQLADALADG